MVGLLTNPVPVNVKVRATVDGATSVDTDAPGGPAKASVQINLGLVGAGVSAPCEMRFDDYVLDRE